MRLRNTWASLAFFGSTLFLMGGVGCGDTGDDDTTSSTGSSSSSTGTGGAGAGTPIKVLQWNCHNLFDDKDNGPATATDEFVETTANYQSHLTKVANVIGMLDPDVAVLAEVENEGILDDLNAKLGNKYSERSVIEGNDPRGVDVAAISKFPFSSVVSHKDDSFVLQGTPAPSYKFARDAVEYHLTFAGKSIVLLGIHFRSKGPPDDANKRLAEAERARAIADSLTAADPNLGVVILGDYNDLPNSDPVKVVAGKAPNLYVDSASALPTADQWTFDFMGAKELIDHQMANPVMAGWLDPKSVVITHSADQSDASDHSPIMATYGVK